MTAIRLLLSALGLLALGVAAPLAAQSPAGGQLLVAAPGVTDPSFAESVVLLIEHGEQGTFGVLIDRPTWVEPADVFPEHPELDAYRGTLYRGGPVQPATLLMLIRSSELQASGARALVGDVFATTELAVLTELEDLSLDESQLRLYAGFAAWEAGDLEREIERGTWRVMPARPELVFSGNPHALWRVLMETGGDRLVRTERD